MTPSQGQVRATSEAARAIATAIKSYTGQQEALLRRAGDTVSRQREAARAELKDRQARLTRASEREAGARILLNRCRENCGGLVEALSRAQKEVLRCEAHVKRAKEASAILEQEHKRFHQAASAWERTSRDHLLSAMAACQAFASRLDEYQRRWTLAEKVILPLEVVLAIAGAAQDFAKFLNAEPIKPLVDTIQEYNEERLSDSIDQSSTPLQDEYKKEARLPPRPKDGAS